MKIIVIIIGILASVAGLAVIGLVATSNSGKTTDALLIDTQKQGLEATKKWELSGDPKDKIEADKWLKLEQDIQKTSENKKFEKQMGFVLGGVLTVLGIGLFGLSFVFGKRQ